MGPKMDQNRSFARFMKISPWNFSNFFARSYSSMSSSKEFIRVVQNDFWENVVQEFFGGFG